MFPSRPAQDNMQTPSLRFRTINMRTTASIAIEQFKSSIPIWQYWIFILCVVIVMLTLLAAIGFTLLSRKEDGEETDDYDEERRSTPGSGGGRPVNPVIYIKPHQTTSQAPPSQTTTQIVCTTSNCEQSRLFPEDSLCDFVFCVSLYIKNPTNKFGVQEQNQVSRQPFFDTAQTATSTRYGMSIDLSNAKVLSRALATQEGIEDYESYWGVKVFDWGFLTVNEFEAYRLTQEIVDAMKILKKMHRHGSSKSGQVVHTFLGIYFKMDLCEMVAHHIRTTFIPTGIISLGHISYLDRNRSDCIIMPPTNLKDPRVYSPRVDYGHSVSDAVAATNCLWNHGVRTAFSVSVTMQGRWYTTRSAGNVPRGQGQQYFYKNCSSYTVYEQTGSIQEMCDDQSLGYARNQAYDNTNKAVISYDEIYGFAITFDNEQSLQFKVCDALKSTQRQLGVAVYDVNYDANTTQCNERWIKGSWERLRFLYRLQNSMNDAYLHPDKNFDCLQITRQ